MMLTVYRASAFFGVASIIGWYVWALLVNDFQARRRLGPGGSAVGPAGGAALILSGWRGVTGAGGPYIGDPHPPALPSTAPTNVSRRTSKDMRTIPGLVTRSSVPQGSRGVAQAYPRSTLQ